MNQAEKRMCNPEYKSSFIVPCNAPYYALYNLTNNCNHIHYDTYQFIVTLCILNSVIIIYDKI